MGMEIYCRREFISIVCGQGRNGQMEDRWGPFRWYIEIIQVDPGMERMVQMRPIGQSQIRCFKARDLHECGMRVL